MERQTIQAENKGHMGDVHIADEVIAIIAGMAATEVEGVKGMVGNLAGDLSEKLGRKNLAKGVKVEMGEDSVSLELAIVVAFGVRIADVTLAIQEKVKNAVETMTSLGVEEVNIRVAGVETDR